MVKKIRRKKEWFDKLDQFSIVQLKAGDFILLRLKEDITQAAMARMQTKMEDFLKKIEHPEIQVLIMGPNLEMDVVRPEGKES